MARILVIDDEPVMQRLVARALPEDDVVVRGDARDALAMLVRGEKFDLILSDLNMPGMGGREFHQAVAVMQPATAALIVFMTGGAVGESDEEFLAGFAGRVLQKPVQIDQLRSLVRSALQR